MSEINLRGAMIGGLAGSILVALKPMRLCPPQLKNIIIAGGIAAGNFGVGEQILSNLEKGFNSVPDFPSINLKK